MIIVNKTEPVRLPKRIILQLKRFMRQEGKFKSLAKFLQDKTLIVKKLK